MITENTKILGIIVNGKRAFDTQAARAAAMEIGGVAAKVSELFEAQEMDPKPEALPAIWENFDDFTVKSQALADTANAASAGIETDWGRKLMGRNPMMIARWHLWACVGNGRHVELNHYRIARHNNMQVI